MKKKLQIEPIDLNELDSLKGGAEAGYNGCIICNGKCGEEGGCIITNGKCRACDDDDDDDNPNEEP